MKRRCQAGQGTVILTLRRLTLVWLTVASGTGCSRQLAIPGPGETAGSSGIPFERGADNSGISPTAGFASDGIPAGTLVTVRLQSPLSSADSRSGDSFQAVLDEPVLVAGKTVAPPGEPVTGSVVAAKASRGVRDPGYLRVTLASIVMNGKSISLQTSSIFAKGGSYQRRKVATAKRSDADDKDAAAEPAVDSGDGIGPLFNSGLGDVKFSTGRRLTFRLAQPLNL
jgi:hypothetical protein